MNNNSELFKNGDGGSVGTSEEQLLKSLYAGDGAGFQSTGGRALIPENVEGSVIVALKEKAEDFKVMNKLKKTTVTSPVFEYARSIDSGVSNIFYSEGAEVGDDTSEIDRVARTSKYMQTLRKVSMQLTASKTIEDAVALEKRLGIHHLLKGCESAIFHGDSEIISAQFDSIPKMIREESKAIGRSTIYDLRGETMLKKGDEALNEITRIVFEAGGSLSHAFMPPAVASDIQIFMQDRIRFNVGDSRGGFVPVKYPSVYGGDIVIGGEEAGADKFYRVKGVVSSVGNSLKPNAPTIALAVETNQSASLFQTEDVGAYKYIVHAYDENGISVGSTLETATIASAKSSVKITITPNADRGGKGFIICRSKKDGTEAREMIRVARKNTATTIFIDNNEDLPGTGEILLLSLNDIDPAVRWNQLLPATKVDMYPTNSLVLPFMIAMFGTPDVRVPWYNGLIKNIDCSAIRW